MKTITLLTILAFPAYSALAAPPTKQKLEHKFDPETIYLPIDKKMFISDPKHPNFIMSSSGNAFFRVKDVHGMITVAALKNKLKPNCIDLVVLANRAQDSGSAEETPRYHFDDNLICEGAIQIDSWKEELKRAKGDSKLQMATLGKIFHSIQDFYSHSNYLEKQIEDDSAFKLNSFKALNIQESSCKEIRTRYFTANNHGESVWSAIAAKYWIPRAHLEDPRSHLYVNKDFHPVHDNYIASMYSRSSFKKFEGRRYFDIIFDIQVDHSAKIFDELKPYLTPEASCE